MAILKRFWNLIKKPFERKQKKEAWLRAIELRDKGQKWCEISNCLVMEGYQYYPSKQLCNMVNRKLKQLESSS